MSVSHEFNSRLLTLAIRSLLPGGETQSKLVTRAHAGLRLERGIRFVFYDQGNIILYSQSGNVVN